MTPLKTTRRVLMWLCVVPFDNYNKGTKILSIILSLTIIGMLLAQLGASAAFFLKFHSTDLESSLYAIYQIFAWMPILYIFVTALLSRHKITTVLVDLSKIYDTITDVESFRFIEKANAKSEWLWGLYIKYAMWYNAVGFAVAGSILSTLISLLFLGHFQRDILYLQFKLILPWDQHTLFGYIGETCFSICVCESYLIVNGAIMLLFVSLALHHRAFYEIFQLSLNNMNSNERQSDKQKFRDLIIFHNMVKSWFYDSAAVYSLLVMILLLNAMLALSCLIFQIDLELKHPDLAIPFLVIAVIVNVSNLFVYCYFGKLANMSYEKMANCLFESNWQRLTTDLQKYIVLMIGNMHRPLFYHGFGFFILDLNTFSGLLRTVLSYYMMLKTITAD